MSNGEYVREDILKSFRTLTRWTVALFISVVLVTGIGFWDAYDRRQALTRVAFETHTALCTFTADLEVRYKSGLAYLKENPGPEPIPGITRETLQNSVDNQKRTLDALAGSLDCS